MGHGMKHICIWRHFIFQVLVVDVIYLIIIHHVDININKKKEQHDENDVSVCCIQYVLCTSNKLFVLLLLSFLLIHFIYCPST